MEVKTQVRAAHLHRFHALRECCIAVEPDRIRLAGVSDEKLAQVVGILDGELQMPYLQEQQQDMPSAIQ